jgi:hypothetical protein
MIAVGRATAVRPFLTLVIGAILLSGCAAKQDSVAAQAASAQGENDRAACLEQASAQSFDEKALAACMRAKGYAADKLSARATPANAGKPPINDGFNTIARQAGPGLPAGEDYERAVANYNNCLLDHTANLSACEEQRALMNADGKSLSRTSSRPSTKILNVEP